MTALHASQMLIGRLLFRWGSEKGPKLAERMGSQVNRGPLGLSNEQIEGLGRKMTQKDEIKEER